MMHQQEGHANDVNGRDCLMFEMAPDASTWTAFAADGHLMDAPKDGDGDGTPGRSYTSSFRFGPDGTFHLFGLWQMETYDQLTRAHLFYVRRTPAGVWETITGDPVSMPLTHPDTSTAADCELPDQLDYTLQTWSMGLDADGNPHINVQGEAPVVRRHHWWDGSAWQHEDTQNYGHLCNIRGDLWVAKTGIWTRIHLLGPDDQDLVISGAVMNGFTPMPDPVRELAGVYGACIPDGDTPRIYTFGEGPRLRAAA